MAAVVWLATSSPSTVTDGVRRLVGTADDPAEEPSEGAEDRSLGRLLVHRSAEGRLSGITVVVTDGDQPGGRILLVPVGAMVEVPGFGLESLVSAEAAGGLPLLQQSIENLLGVRLGVVGELDPSAWAKAVGAAGTLTVQLGQPVEVVSEGGRVEVVFADGAVAVEPDAVGALLDTPGQQSQLERLVRHQAFWEAWLEQVGDDRSRAPGGDTPGDLGSAVETLARGSVDFEVLPVDNLGTATGGQELYQPRGDDVRALVDAWFPDAASLDQGERIRVQVLNGVGAPAVASTIQPALIEAGAEVVLSGNAATFDQAVTEVVYYDEAERELAERVLDALGAGQLVFSRTGLDVVDVTVVVGADLVPIAESDEESGEESE